MNAEIWAIIGTIVATLVLFIVPALVYAWYALEYLIDDKRSYARVIAKSNGGTTRCGSRGELAAHPRRRSTPHRSVEAGLSARRGALPEG